MTTHEELIKLVKGGYFFHFCLAFAVNKGFLDVIKEKKEVKFSVGDYDVVFEPKGMSFTLTHKIYFARIITTYQNHSIFIGEDEEEVINELLIELEKVRTETYMQ